MSDERGSRAVYCFYSVCIVIHLVVLYYIGAVCGSDFGEGPRVVAYRTEH